MKTKKAPRVANAHEKGRAVSVGSGALFGCLLVNIRGNVYPFNSYVNGWLRVQGPCTTLGAPKVGAVFFLGPVKMKLRQCFVDSRDGFLEFVMRVKRAGKPNLKDEPRA